MLASSGPQDIFPGVFQPDPRHNPTHRVASQFRWTRQCSCEVARVATKLFDGQICFSWSDLFSSFVAGVEHWDKCLG